MCPEFQELLRWAQEGVPDEEGEIPKKKKKKKAKTTTKAKKPPKADDAEPSMPPPSKGKCASDVPDGKGSKAKSRTLPEGCAYRPGEYNEVRLKFIRKRQKLGWTYRDASTFWNSSRTRSKLLENMPHAEKVRRRFV